MKVGVSFVINCFRGGRGYASFIPQRIAFAFPDSKYVHDYMQPWYQANREEVLKKDGRQIRKILDASEVKDLHQEGFLTVAVKETKLADLCMFNLSPQNNVDNKDPRDKSHHLISNLHFHGSKDDRRLLGSDYLPNPNYEPCATVRGNEVTVTNQARLYFPSSANKKIVEAVTYHELSDEETMHYNLLRSGTGEAYEKNWPKMIDIASRYKVTFQLKDNLPPSVDASLAVVAAASVVAWSVFF
ncbi:MAG: hypothetical protein ACYCQJ_13340 [Nitrososphaerales archaeon]